MSDVSGASSTEGEKGLVLGQDGLVSERIVEGEIGSSIIEGVRVEDNLDSLTMGDIARDIRSTSSGRTCFPSDLV